nr:reverse transcriptase domain-containing protein [Tanacetum cinerariifolium]
MDLKQVKETKAKSSIEEPPELELKELPSHLEYAFLEDTDKLTVIIAKDLKDVEKEALIKKILMEEDYKLVVQSQRRVNPKIHDVNKKEVIKLLHAGIIYPISNNPWVSPIHFVPKKGGMTVVANESNELIPTRDSFSLCLSNLDKMLKRCEDTNLVLNWEKYHFMCKEGIVLGHKISKSGIQVYRAKVDVIAKLPHPTNVKGVRSFLGHAALKYLLIKQDAKPRLLQWVLLLQEFDIIIRNKKGSKNLAADHLSRLENPHKDVLENKDINKNFPLETLASLSSGKRKVGENRASWSDKLDDALWAFCTAFKTPIGCTPYKLVYEKSCHIPIELEHNAYWALKHVNFDLKTVGDHRKLQLNELNELRDQAYENYLIFKERTKKLHDSKIKNHIFNVGDQVLLFNSRLKIFSRKLKTHWSSLFTITQVFPYGTIELSQPDGPNFKVNGHRVKHYFRGDIPSKVVPDLHTFPMDK